VSLITKKTREEDDRLRGELEKADIEKFKKTLKLAIAAPKSKFPPGKKHK
jgi:hypothetical protein